MIVPGNPIYVLPYKTSAQISKLPNLTALQWPPLHHAPYPAGVVDEYGRPVYVPPPFEPMISKGQRALYEKLLRLFSDTMFRNGLGNRFMLHAGTVLGSYRHHDRIPWDDDLDILVDVEVRPQVQQLLRALEPEYKLTEYGMLDKFYRRFINDSDTESDLEYSRRIPRYSWGWPFIDLFYYRATSKNLYELALNKRIYPIHMIYPLVFRPLGTEWYPTPFKVLDFIRLTVGYQTRCYSTHWSHSSERSVRAISTDCQDFKSKFAFVRHSRCELSPLEIENWGHIDELMAMGREELVISSENNTETVLHSLCFPVHRNSVSSYTYVLEPL